MADSETADLRVLIFAPVGRDGTLTSELLTAASIPCHVCGSFDELCEKAADGAGALLLTEEALSDRNVTLLADVLASQPAWSDTSVLLFVGGERNQATLRTMRCMELLRNVTLLDRPVRKAALISTVQAALRGRRRQYELRDVLSALYKARVDAEQANQLKDEFLAIVSHELRTPLNAILGWVSMLRQARFEPSRVDTILEIIERNAKAQAQLIADVLDISRMIGGRVTLRLEPVSLARIVCDAADAVRPGAVAKGLSLQVDVDDDLIVSADPDRLQQVVWNILSNACKFTPEGGRIEVGLTASRSTATIRIVDTGLGISPDFLPFVFDRFRQADQGFTRATGGLGLGLAIAKQLVEMHGGQLRAASEGVGHGSTFEVRLPMARRRRKPVALPQTASPRAPQADLSHRAVLVVEDEQATRELLATMLSQAGAQVTAVDSAAAALAHLDIHVPELMLADIGMPGEDGLSMMKRIRQRSPGRGGLLRAIAVSAYARPQDRTAALAAGFDDFLTKPVLPADVIRTVARWLGKAPATKRRRHPRGLGALAEAADQRPR